jgi:hypothetical protein
LRRREEEKKRGREEEKRNITGKKDDVRIKELVQKGFFRVNMLLY